MLHAGVASLRGCHRRRRWEIEGHGVDDESAGYHRRHTSWHWSAGVGCAADGRPVAWNLVTGINDPPERSERAIWVAGVPVEPPGAFSGSLDGIELAEGLGVMEEHEALW